MFSSKKSAKKLIAVFDISSGSIGGALAKIPADENIHPEIIFSTRNIISGEHDLDFNLFLNLTLKTLQRTAQELLETRIGAPSEIHVMLSAPWSTSHKRIIDFEKREEFKFTDKLLEQLLAKDSDPDLSREVQFSGMGDLNVFEREMMRVKLNGYPILNPVNQESRHAEVEIWSSAVSSDVKSKFIESINRVFSVEPTFHSSIFSLYKLTKGLYPNEDNAIIIDIGGETTEIGIVKNDVLEQFATFPIGENEMLRTLGQEMNTPGIDQTYNIFNMYFDGKLDSKTDKKVSEILNAPRTKWFKGFASTLEELSKSGLLPNTLFISANRDLQSWVYEEIFKNGLNNLTHGHAVFNGISLDEHEVSKYIDSRGGNLDTALGLQVLFTRMNK